MTGERLTEIPIVFYRTSGGVEPVRDWLRVLTGDDRQKIGFDLAALQIGWPVGMPLCRSLGGGLWEMRSSLPSRRIARVQKTPRDEIELARKRMKEMTT